MPRKSRIDAPGALHHIICRGIERCPIFQDEADREDFLDRLKKILPETSTLCFAWALIPNHFHLLLKTGHAPIATVMRRVLTGYATAYNRRHRRSGHLFQNRYKSILCQEDAYMKELVRYIHLNPLRASLVKDFDALGNYRYSGHSVLLGKRKIQWQTTDSVLALFGEKVSLARRRYQDFVKKGAGIGRCPKLTGGGLIRSAGGWHAVKAIRKAGIFQKSDERILGDSDFVETVLANAQETFDRSYQLKQQGITFEQMVLKVSTYTGIDPAQLEGPSKVRDIVRTRYLICYWGTKELGLSMTAIAGLLNISVPTVSVAYRKGEKVVKEENLSLTNMLNIKI